MNPTPAILLQLTSLQGKKSRSLNSLTIEFEVTIRNNAPRPFQAPHSSACNDSLAFPGGMLQLRANGFWAASAALVPRIAPQRSVTLHIITRPSVGFKTPNELDVDAKFDLFSDTTARTLVPCSGTFATDGAIWQKSVIEFAGDVLHARPTSQLRSSINVLFVGAAPQSGTSSLINAALTTLSFSKQPLDLAPVGLAQTEPAGGIARVSRYKPGADAEKPDDEDDDSTCDVDSDDDDDECRVRLLDISENVATSETLCAIVDGCYDIENTCESVEHPGDRRCDAVVLVVPAPLLMSGQLQQAIAKYQALLRARAKVLIAITMADLVSNTEEELRTAAKLRFGANRAFVARSYRGEEKRCALIEKPVLALLLAATRQF